MSSSISVSTDIVKNSPTLAIGYEIQDYLTILQEIQTSLIQNLIKSFARHIIPLADIAKRREAMLVGVVPKIIDKLRKEILSEDDVSESHDNDETDHDVERMLLSTISNEANQILGTTIQLVPQIGALQILVNGLPQLIHFLELFMEFFKPGVHTINKINMQDVDIFEKSFIDCHRMSENIVCEFRNYAHLFVITPDTLCGDIYNEVTTARSYDRRYHNKSHDISNIVRTVYLGCNYFKQQNNTHSTILHELTQILQPLSTKHASTMHNFISIIKNTYNMWPYIQSTYIASIEIEQKMDDDSKSNDVRINSIEEIVLNNESMSSDKELAINNMPMSNNDQFDLSGFQDADHGRRGKRKEKRSIRTTFQYKN